MASLAEVRDITQDICRQFELEVILIWANRIPPTYLHHERGPPLPLEPILRFEDVDERGSPLPLKTILYFQDFACVTNSFHLAVKRLLKWHYEEGEGIVGKALKYNRPFYVPVIESLSSAYASCGDFVVEFLLPRSSMTLQIQKQLVHRIIDYLKDATPRFVTYGNQDTLVELAEHDTAVSDTMPVFNLNLINQTVGNVMNGQLPMQQLHYTGVSDAMPTQGNLPAQSTDSVGLKVKTFGDNPRDGNVLQRPHEQGSLIQQHVSATSNVKASTEDILAPPIGDSNLNERISSIGINQTAEYHVTDMQVPHKQVPVTIN
ncbi:hypothetical protein SLEP1_g44447 [Rubroshorea leprosula]|uniref:Uncharacterized protein n=1 Tax=Rubroshorea leprosula TaxID=152421 RepID=A0AAV5LGS3_9ROSI|nr:hypothetical protein SLEP1_g44447 [Rubroshorea leprosula]